MKSGMKKGDHRRIKTGGSGKTERKETCILSFDLYPGVRKEEMMELANALQPDRILISKTVPKTKKRC